MKIKVLHLSLSHGGGVISAMETYISNSLFAEHSLVAVNDESCQVDFSDQVKLSKRYDVKLNFKGLLDIYKAVKEINPTYIHLHSSHAGAIGRILFPFHKNIIYTPHCYSFERTDISSVLRIVFYSVEWLLALKPTLVAGCSPREVELANDLGISSFKRTKNNVFLTNYSMPTTVWDESSYKNKSVVMVGRICPQKDAQFFIDTYNILRNLDSEIKFYWLGNGSSEDVNYLTMNELLNSSLYFHCAAWEGNPMSILEVAAMEVPIVSREIRSIKSLGLTHISPTEKGCAELIYKYFNFDPSLALEQHKLINNMCSLEVQKNALTNIYSCG